MAIIKTYRTPQGVDATYHRILTATIDVNIGAIRVLVAVYANAEVRDASGPPLWHEYVNIPFADLTQDPRDLLYPMLSFYVGSFLGGGTPDQEGSGSPGNFEINLRPEVVISG